MLAAPRAVPWVRPRLWLVLRYAFLLGSLATLSVDAYALTAQEIYRQAERQVVVLEMLDEQGAIFSSHTALLLDKGKVVTQCDLLAGAASLRLRQRDAVYPAKAAQKDSARNLCLLSAPGADPAHAPVLQNDEPETGAQVYALSNALGMGISVAEGIVSGIRKSRGESFIQFTAAIAPGSGGGGLFDANGRVVGLINYRQRDGQNVNFALPARWLNNIEQRAADTDATEIWRVKAMALERAAKWKELAAHAARWAKSLQDSAEAWLWLGYAAERSQDWPTAERAYREVLQHEPSAVQAGTGLATALLFQNKPKEAFDTARSMLAYRQEDARVWLTLAYAERALDRLDEAKQAFERAVQLDSWNREAHIGLASIARLRGDWPRALAAQRQIIRIEPQDATAWTDLAEMYYRTNRPQRALSSAERAIALAPTNGDAWIAKGAALLALKRYQEAIATLKKGLALEPKRPAWGWGWLGDTYYGLSLYPEAIAAYREATKLEPGNTALKGSLGIALKDGLQFEEALDLFEKLKTDYPNDPFPWRQIGFVHGYLGQAERAIPAHEQSLSLDPKQSKVWHSLMEAYHMLGRHDDVKRAYQKLLPLEPGRAEYAYRTLILPYGVAP